MRKMWLLPASLVVLAGCGLQDPAPTANACKDCGPEKCYKTIKVPVTEQVPVTELKAVEKDCVVETVKPTTKKVPVKTYRVVEEWVDAPVQEAYTEQVPVRKKTQVPVKEQYLGYENVTKKVDTTFACSKTTTKSEWTCEHKTDSKDITQCGVCGGKNTISATREYSVPKLKTTTETETAKCQVPMDKIVSEPAMKDRTVTRDGYYTEMETVTKYRTVPGKVLVKKKVCDTVMTDMPDTTVESKPVKRTIAEREVKTKTVTKMVDKKVEIDCKTGLEIAPVQQAKESEPAKLDIAQIAAQATAKPAAAR